MTGGRAADTTLFIFRSSEDGASDRRRWPRIADGHRRHRLAAGADGSRTVYKPRAYETAGAARMSSNAGVGVRFVLVTC